MPTFIHVRIAFLLVIALQSYPIFAQSPITIDLVTDRSYISPGGEITLVVEISNPADSGTIIERLSGSSYGLNLASQNRHLAEFTANAQCSQGLCPVDPAKGLPVRPGTSAQFYFNSLRVSANAPAGLLIRVSDIRLKLISSEQRHINDVHLQRDFVAIVSPGGQGDSAYINSQLTANPKAGSANINATLTLHYPDMVTAGNHIEVTGTISNHGSEPITSHFILGSLQHLGNHVRSYRQIFCQFKCLYNGQFPLLRGDTIDVLFRQMYYESDFLFSGNLQIKGPHAIVRDRLNRTAYVYADDININITHAGDQRSPATYPPIPQREPLTLTTSRDPSPRTVVYDPNTRKSWIPLLESQGMSFAQVIAQTNKGGRFEGYSIANSEEVRTLFLNHIYASRLNYPEYALFVGNKDLHAVSGTFLDLFGETLASGHVGGTTRYGQAMVSDAPEPDNQSVNMGIWQQNGSTGIFGMTGSFSKYSFHASQSAGMGTWLVNNSERTGTTLALSDSDGADFRYGQLFISSVTVEGQNYKASFSVINKDDLVLELVSIVDEFSREPAAMYDAESLILQIPRLAYFIFPNDYVYFDVELVLIPDTEPPQFRVITAESVVE